ncbi:hypothetical protein C2G38_2256236 [Gigaspora rosea]|uniref:Uncharacterized protein n=1 Tax=Gigaspora rosea TaxID=44941 RepID=A0A397TT79_9GLOM|nr:hypothetical protein C2G38_2256236 [Gigaspora rosea]
MSRKSGGDGIWKLPNISGFSQKEHPANLLYLVWDLHNSYNKSDKDKPMEWLLSQLKDRPNTPKSYIKKWELLQKWLHDPILNLQIKFLVRFGRDFYYPMAKFLTGHDSELYLIDQTSKQANLPPGRRAHQMEEFVTRTIVKLQNIIEDPYSFLKKNY